MALLSQADHDRVVAAIAKAESRTSGEIVCVIKREGFRFAEVPWAFAALGAFLAPFALVAAAGDPGQLLDVSGWDGPAIPLHLIAIGVIAGVQALTFLVLFALAHAPAISAALTPKSAKRLRTRQAALEQFQQRGLSKTREHTGVLIFCAAKDRCVEIIADAGIYAKVDASIWRGAVDALVAKIKTGEPAAGFIAAIEAAGAVLAEHFPSETGGANELANEIYEI